ncbi:YbaN family protein [Odoribacter laneus]|uniref:YbaN family protein n=1 Tax=Odoribacter laneus TaxID=626933 RepID=UPI0023F28CF2|nr:YbaN family protein [Odoribacter laneus]
MRKILYITLGILSIILGIIGIFVPGLPTTPFLLLSSWLFYKSSQKLHDRLHRSRWLGKYIRHYESKQGVSITSKVISILCMWIMINISAFCFLETGYIRIVLFVLGAIGTASILWFVPTATSKTSPPSGKEHQ